MQNPRTMLRHFTRGTLARTAISLIGAALALLPFMAIARAQDAAPVLDQIESGRMGFSGMLAGLLVIALATLALRHRRAISLNERIAKLEAAVEDRDDKIWTLEEQLAHTKKLADAQGDLVAREDAHGRVTYVSEMFSALLHKPAEALCGHRDVADVRHERNRTEHEDGSTSFDQEIMTPEGSRWIAWKEVAIRDDAGELIETQRVGRDVTARVAEEHALAEASEKAESASRAKSRFLAVVSHEVRTPLNGVLGMADLLLETDVSPEQKTYAKSIKNSGEALLALIEEILDFSKIEAGRLDLQSRPFDLAELVVDVVELLAPRAQNKGIEIAAEIADDLPPRVAGDAARLRQVLLNLAGNAVKFTENGGVLVVVERGKKDQIRFVVEDSGPGVSADAQARIFEEFEQGDGTLARRHGGTGLGLAIAGRIVERMGGEIALHSGNDEGSVFSFAIDLPAVTDAGAAAAFAAPDISGHDILIASPSRIVGPMLERKLASWGANVALASDMQVAETLLPERDWTHLFVDRAFGAEAASALTHLAAQHVRQKLILLSPAERSELPDLREAGFDGYFVKPVRAGSLAVRLAADPGEHELLADFDADRVITTPRMRALAVLIAEDNEINALLAQAMLGKLGHIPTVVADGNAAVNAVIDAHAMGAPYDLVLMDLHLPGMDGLEATRKIRALPGAGRVPVIALTANAFAEDRAACSEAGMDAFVVKPFDRDQLDEAISKARGINALRAANAA